jgi:DNA polymerase III subunit delta
MTSAEFNKILEEGRLPALLLFYGEERLLIDRAVKLVCDLAVPPEARDFNWHRFRGKDIQGAAILDTAYTLPVFSPRRLVFLQDAQEAPASELEALLGYLRDPSPETLLLITTEKIDARRKFYQEFKKVGTLVEFKRYKDHQIPAFIQEQARADARSFTEDAMALFCRRLGNDLQEIQAELEKLFSYMGEKKLVDVADVNAVVCATRVDSVFDLTNAMGGRKTEDALKCLGRLLDEGMAPLLILTMMVRHVRNLWKTRQLMEEKAERGEIAQRIEVNPYFINGLMSQARMFSAAQFRDLFDRFLAVDLALKSSGAHPGALLEGLVLDVCRDSSKAKKQRA